MGRKNIYIDDETQARLSKLARDFGGNESMVIREAVRRLDLHLHPEAEPVIYSHTQERVKPAEACGDCGLLVEEGWREVWTDKRRGALVCSGCIQ